MYFNQMEFGQRIKEERNRIGLTQEELACRLNIGYVHMNSIEKGRKGCSIDLLLELSELLNVSTDYLLTGRIRSGKELKEQLEDVLASLDAIIRKIDRN